MKLQAINNYITAEKADRKDQEEEGLYLPETQQTNIRWHKVLSKGEGVPDFNGNFVPVEVEVDDMVYIQNHGQFNIEGAYFKGEDQVVASINDVMAYYRDEAFQPLGNLIEIEKIELDEEETNGVYMTKTFQYPSNVGIVKTLGLGWKNPNGGSIPFQVSVGDTVVYNPFAERTINMLPMSKEKRYLISHGDIFAVVPK